MRDRETHEIDKLLGVSLNFYLLFCVTVYDVFNILSIYQYH